MYKLKENKDIDDLMVDVCASSTALQPRSGTPLEELVKSTTVVPLNSLSDKPKEELSIILSEQSDNSIHNGWTNEVGVRAATIFNRRINVIREVVLPTVKSISEAVIADVTKIGETHADTNIKRYSICDAVNIDSFMKDVNKDTSTKYDDPVAFFRENEESLETILKILKTGNNVLDEIVALAASSVGDYNLFRMWGSIFVDRAKMSISNFANFSNFIYDRDHGLEYAVLIYILALNLKDNDAKASREYREAAAYVINLQARAYKNDIENGVLIKSRSNNNLDIVVYSLTYTKFLQNGGTAEMVIGAANNSRYFSTYKDILENAKEVESSYNVVKGASQAIYKKEVRAATTNSLVQHFARTFKYELSDYEKAYFEKNPGDMSLVITKFDNLLGMVSSDSIKDIHRKVCEIVCNSRFFYMDCFKFLKNVDDLCVDGAKPEDAFSQAIIEEISTFVVSQITA